MGWDRGKDWLVCLLKCPCVCSAFLCPHDGVEALLLWKRADKAASSQGPISVIFPMTSLHFPSGSTDGVMSLQCGVSEGERPGGDLRRFAQQTGTWVGWDGDSKNEGKTMTLWADTGIKHHVGAGGWKIRCASRDFPMCKRSRTLWTADIADRTAELASKNQIYY